MSHPVHPKKTQARVLLTSVFGPYAQDDVYGSRAINPMELYHNQVTRAQGPFSLRMFHRSWGIMMIQANIDAPSTLLDFPELGHFISELRENEYDIVGISSIIPNIGKVRKMTALVRELSPNSTIVVGGHIANFPGIEQQIDADHIVRGEGIAWFRQFLGQDPSRPIEHPDIISGLGARIMGMPLRERRGDVAAVVIPSVGCPMGCNFCATSAMFGGKGNFVNFYDSGQDLFRIMCGLETRLKVQSFFVMDENFLLYRKRALQLLDQMKEHGKSWSLYVFSSANALRRYSDAELLGLGVAWVWMGLEGEDSVYEKLNNTDTRHLVNRLQSHGIRVLGSSIIGLENHTPENIDRAIDRAVEHDTDFHQFMLYTPVPGTPLYEEHRKNRTLLLETDEADSHGQFRFNFRHPHISREQSGEFLLQAFGRDYDVNGPSIFRIARTVLRGWKRHKEHPEPRVRARLWRDARKLPWIYSGVLWAMERYFHESHPDLTRKIRSLRAEIGEEFGALAAFLSPTIGSFLLYSLRREERRLNRGAAYEPPTFIERKYWMGVRHDTRTLA